MKAILPTRLRIIGIAAASLAASASGGLSPAQLRCEYLRDPMGIDVARPRLSWVLQATDEAARDQTQTAYQVLVASTPQRLAADEGDLWDSDKVVSNATVHIEYAGPPLVSRQRCYWKVRVWDEQDRPSGWSEPASWSMGLLKLSDWQAQWISHAADAARQTGRRDHNGFHSALAPRADEARWVAVDLKAPRQFDAVQLHPARPYNWIADVPGFNFPKRFRIEVANEADFSDARAVVDRSRADVTNPRERPLIERFAPQTGRYVRLYVTNLDTADGVNYAFALAELRVLSGEQNLAQDMPVLASESLEMWGWSRDRLTDGRLKPDRGDAYVKATSAIRLGWLSDPAASPDTAQWVAVDLGEETRIDGVRFHPARRAVDAPFLTYDVGYLFPRRFKIEVDTQADFSTSQVVVDHTGRDAYNPGTDAREYRFNAVEARHIRVTFTTLRTHSATVHGVAMAELAVLAGDRNVAAGAKVTASGSGSEAGWSLEYLNDGRESSEDPAPRNPAASVRKEFSLDRRVARATLYATALGAYELRLNGQRIGDQRLAPEWTGYDRRVQYQVHEVTDLLRAGRNAIAAHLGEGWYGGRIISKTLNAQEYPRLLVQLEIEFADGSREVVVSDGSWRSSTDGPIRFSGIYDGEEFDARRSAAGWDRPGFDDSAWPPVHAQPLDDRLLSRQPNEPIRVIEERSPVAIFETRPGVYLMDMGQNIVGRVRLSVSGPAGTTVTLRHGEMLNPDRSLFYNLKGGTSEVRYTLSGAGEETYEPQFTYQGFRYVEATGLPHPPTPGTVTGLVLHSDAPLTSEFESSSEQLNRLMEAMGWTMRGNLTSVLTDCPQRDERLGWMGDAQAFSGTMPYLMDVAAFTTKWAADMRDAQGVDGVFPPTVPAYGLNFPSAGWADAAIVLPWRLYEFYGDRRILQQQYEPAKRWIEWCVARNPDLIWKNHTFGDWLNADRVFIDGIPRSGGDVPAPVIGTAFFAHSVRLMSSIAAVLGHDDDARRYDQLHRKIVAAFQKEFVQSDGSVLGDTQGGYAIALHFDLLPPPLIRPAAARMVDLFDRYHGHLSTGIQATHRLMLELTRHGYHEEAFRVLMLRTPPSWGYMLDSGATTIWERWDGYHAQREEHPDFMGWMNSFNHVALGAVGEWVWRHLVGIQPDLEVPGFEHIIIRPAPGPGLTRVRGAYDSVRGRIESHWWIEAEKFNLQIRIPPNTRATVYIPTGSPDHVQESGRPVAPQAGIKRLADAPGCAVVQIGSGYYSFTAPRQR